MERTSKETIRGDSEDRIPEPARRRVYGPVPLQTDFDTTLSWSQYFLLQASLCSAQLGFFATLVDTQVAPSDLAKKMTMGRSRS